VVSRKIVQWLINPARDVMVRLKGIELESWRLKWVAALLEGGAIGNKDQSE
jgi:hypothetical protein